MAAGGNGPILQKNLGSKFDVTVFLNKTLLLPQSLRK
jgi:hypothetical protein